MFTELKTKKTPTIKSFHQISKTSKLKFHVVCVYVKNHLKESVIRVPDEDIELDIALLIIEQTTLVCNIFTCYLDVERSDKDKTNRVWHKLIVKVQS